MTTIDEALRAVLEPGQTIVVAQGSGEPRRLIESLGSHPELLRGSRVIVGLLHGELPRLPETEIRAFFPSGPLGTEAAMREHSARYERRSLYELAAAFRSGEIAVDVALGQATEARAGRHSLGPAVDYFAAAVERADRTVLEVSAAAPWTGPRSTVAAGERVIAIADAPPPLPSAAPAASEDTALAENVARWIPDGATVELGMGRWIPALVERLRGRRSLRIHTGLVGDWVLGLLEAGAVAPAVPVLATAAAGSEGFYQWLGSAGGEIELAPADETHAPEALRSLPAFRAVNSVLEVDLLGRLNAEVGSGGRRGGIGGLKDFAAGASRNPDGISIIALPASSRGRGRIVAPLPKEKVSLPADAAEVVATEHGCADLRGLEDPERVRALIAIAAPEHRAELGRLAAERELL